MLVKLIDEVFGIIGVIIGFLVLVIGGGIAYYYYPITTCIIGGLFLLSAIISALDISLSEVQAEKLGEITAIVLIITAIGFAFYFFPKTTGAVIFLMALGFIVKRIEERKSQKAICLKQ
ncbi:MULTISPECIES: hypothetical protein [unclassified Pasteurella]|uniref:hypothetical protein n=1 Tax=unclassified Pasteurella TaxID=2621516 RepID=UPI001073390F|nr:hypothetical protein [Pasteurella sp. 19428wF3_WM03]TFU50476.1 hypothetical protein E4T92_08890 [Pasteurella sp. WM03]